MSDPASVSEQPRVSVGILTFNRRDALKKALESVLAQDRSNLEVVVVDSASTDGTQELVRDEFPSVNYIRLPRNLGCPEGRNHILANCSGEFVVSVDDDGFLAEDAVRHVVAAFASDPTIGVVALRQVFTDEPGSKTQTGDETPLTDAGCFSGGVSAFRRSMLDQTGGYPHDFFLFAEESFLSLRALEAGYRIVSEPRAVMFHPRAGSSVSTANDYHRFRNPLLVVVRLFPPSQLVVYLPGRLISYFFISIRRGSFLQYLKAALGVLGSLPWELSRRTPVSRATVRRQLSLRSPEQTG